MWSVVLQPPSFFPQFFPSLAPAPTSCIPFPALNHTVPWHLLFISHFLGTLNDMFISCASINSFCKYPCFLKVYIFVNCSTESPDDHVIQKKTGPIWDGTLHCAVTCVRATLLLHDRDMIWCSGVFTGCQQIQLPLLTTLLLCEIAASSHLTSLQLRPISCNNKLFSCPSFYLSEFSGCKMLNLWNKAGVSWEQYNFSTSHWNRSVTVALHI